MKKIILIIFLLIFISGCYTNMECYSYEEKYECINPFFLTIYVDEFGKFNENISRLSEDHLKYIEEAIIERNISNDIARFNVCEEKKRKWVCTEWR